MCWLLYLIISQVSLLFLKSQKKKEAKEAFHSTMKKIISRMLSQCHSWGFFNRVMMTHVFFTTLLILYYKYFSWDFNGNMG